MGRGEGHLLLKFQGKGEGAGGEEVGWDQHYLPFLLLSTGEVEGEDLEKKPTNKNTGTPLLTNTPSM